MDETVKEIYFNFLSKEKKWRFDQVSFAKRIAILGWKERLRRGVQ